MNLAGEFVNDTDAEEILKEQKSKDLPSFVVVKTIIKDGIIKIGYVFNSTGETHELNVSNGKFQLILENLVG